MSASTTSLMNQPPKMPSPDEKAAVNWPKEISDDTDLSNSHRMKGSSRNISTPLRRCAPDTSAASGQR